jgi:hypothetical protein
MQHLQTAINTYNDKIIKRHREKVELTKNLLELTDRDFDNIIESIRSFQTPYRAGHWAQAEHASVVSRKEENHVISKRKLKTYRLSIISRGHQIQSRCISHGTFRKTLLL